MLGTLAGGHIRAQPLQLLFIQTRQTRLPVSFHRSLRRAIQARSVTAPDMEQRTVTIDVVSDNVCPWCYVGKSRLERAISSFQGKSEGKDILFNVNWHPYQLNPKLPQDDSGKDKREMYRAKFGVERAEGIISRMTAAFEDEGLPPYSMDGITGSTFNSHRLVAWAGAEHGAAVQNRLIDALFRGYFTEAKYPNDKEFLKAAAEEAGLPRESASAVIEDPRAYADQVEKEVQQAYAAGISGVPNFTIGSARLSGAQDPASLEKALASAAAS